jgi:ubiquinone/menaquinone biosynthesis C-methylase UbiE
MRRKVYAHLTRLLPNGSRILELNAGTGVDALYLAQQGYSVHATDIARGMLHLLEKKVVANGLQRRITIQECSFTNLEQIIGGPYDAIFSNLGGLNCIPDLTLVSRHLPVILNPGGIVTWVLMPPICLWELGLIFKGQFHTAFRRLHRRGTRTHLEGLYFNTYYFSPNQVMAIFGNDFKVLSVEGLSVITPTAESRNLYQQHPHLYKLLCWFDDRLAPYSPWRGWGDFYIISLRFSPL